MSTKDIAYQCPNQTGNLSPVPLNWMTAHQLFYVIMSAGRYIFTWPVNITGSLFVPGEGSGAQRDFTYSIFHYMQGTLCGVLGPWHIIPQPASSIAVKREKIIKPQAISEEGWTDCLSWLGSATCKQSLNPLSPET